VQTSPQNGKIKKTYNSFNFTLGSIYNIYASGAEQMTKTNNSNIIKHNRVKNPNCPKAEQLAIYKRGRGFELGTIENKSS